MSMPSPVIIKTHTHAQTHKRTLEGRGEVVPSMLALARTLKMLKQQLSCYAPGEDEEGCGDRDPEKGWRLPPGGVSSERCCPLGSQGLLVTVMVQVGEPRSVSEVAPLPVGVTPNPSAAPSFYALKPLLPRPAHNVLLNTTWRWLESKSHCRDVYENTVGVLLRPSQLN